MGITLRIDNILYHSLLCLYFCCFPFVCVKTHTLSMGEWEIWAMYLFQILIQDNVHL